MASASSPSTMLPVCVFSRVRASGFRRPVYSCCVGSSDPEVLDGPVLERFRLPMSSLRRAINLIVALTLVALGAGGLVYFYVH